MRYAPVMYVHVVHSLLEYYYVFVTISLRSCNVHALQRSASIAIHCIIEILYLPPSKSHVLWDIIASSSYLVIASKMDNVVESANAPAILYSIEITLW
jgi:hypothetical protein